MAEDRMAVLEVMRKAIAEGDADFLREGVRVLAQARATRPARPPEDGRRSAGTTAQGQELLTW